MTKLCNKDNLFTTEDMGKDFEFNNRVVEVFDDMLDRSVPFYQDVIKYTANLFERHLAPHDRIVDLGCSTGTTLLHLATLLKNKEFSYLGIDDSDAMLKKARLKSELFSKSAQIAFQKNDITKIDIPQTGGFIINYTLQFVRPIKRPKVIKQIYNNLKPGGLLVLSEKTINHDTACNQSFIDIYHQFKRERGYSELEISRKREALENILIPFSINENKFLLKEAGFSSVNTFFQWFNFVSFMAIK